MSRLERAKYFAKHFEPPKNPNAILKRPQSQWFPMVEPTHKSGR